MRHWIVIVAAILLLAACHRKEQKDSGDTLCPRSATDLTTDATGESGAIDGQTIDPNAATGERHSLQRDSAQTTNLRIIRNKKTTIYSPTLLVGEWIRGNEHWEYHSDGTGLCWNTDDDVSREEAQPFHWKMADNELEVKLTMKMGGVVIKQYTVTFVDDETLSYNDIYGEAYLWDRLP